MSPDSIGSGSKAAARTFPLLALYPLLFAAVYLGHFTLLHLPYFWDEGGYYIPAALDFFRTGTLIPQSTITNAHPPLPAILLAAVWRLSGVTIIATRTFTCMIAAAGLLAVFHLARTFVGQRAAAAVTLLTAIYPIWYVQSTLAHADIFAAAFTLWALALYLPISLPPRNCHPALQRNCHPEQREGSASPQRLQNFPAQPQTQPQTLSSRPKAAHFAGVVERSQHYPATNLSSRPEAKPQWRDLLPRATTIAILFALSVLSKETAIVTPFALALHRLYLLFREPESRRENLLWLASLGFCVLPLLAWYGYHYHRTGFVFGNPEFLRYNATANLDAHRIALSLYHRALHLLGHMNMWVAALITIATLLLPRRIARSIPTETLTPILILLIANWIAFSILGGALLTRYLLPMYPLLLLLFVATWRERTSLWPLLAALPAVAFVVALHINPPYAFAPEDNLTYRDMIVLHQQAVALIEQKFPQATVLTAWPANAELSRPDLGYTHTAIKVTTLQNFALDQLQKAAQSPGDFDTALLFSTKYEPPASRTNLSQHSQNTDARYFDFHRDVLPAAAARLLHGDVIWQAERNGEWAAVLRFPRTFEAQLTPNF